MKIRNGFVSNSSTSSFVIIGTTMTDEQLVKLFKLKNIEEDGGDALFEKLDKLQLERPMESDVVGEYIAVSFDDGDPMEDQDISFADLQKTAKRVAKKLNVKLSKIHLYTGTASC